MLIVPALLLVLAFSVLITAVLRPPARPAALLSVYLLSYANIVMVGQVANTFYRLNSPLLWLSLHVLLAVIALIVWELANRPPLLAPFVGADNARMFPTGWRETVTRWPELWLLAGGVAAGFLFSFFLLWVMPPNNNDSLATHMSRVAYWYQRGAFFPWPSQRVWQISYPVNMQLQMFWTVLFTGSDRLVESVQWVGAVMGVITVYGLAALLGASRPQALFASLLWATFPEIILESTTTQNDLVAGTLFAALVYLLLLGARGSRGAMALSGLGFGLAMGTKQTLFFLLPGLALLCLLLLWRGGKQAWKRLWIWAGSATAAFLLVGAYMFAVNFVNFGHPMGPETAVSAQTGGQTPQSLLQNLGYNTFRLAYQSIDPSGLPDPLWGYGVKLKALMVGAAVRAVGFPIEAEVAVATGHRFSLRDRYVMQEDAAWYGPLFSFLVLPALLWQFAVGIRTGDPARIGIFFLGLTFLLINAAFRPGWDPFQGRYFIPVVTLAAPMAAFLFRAGEWAQRAARWAVALLALIVMIITFISNSGKPIIGGKTIWQMDWLDRATIQSFYMRAPARLVDRHVPADTSVGLYTFGTFLEYPFFRSEYSRRLVQIYPPERALDTQWLREQGIEYLIVQRPPANASLVVPELPLDLMPVATEGDWSIYIWAR